MREFAGAPLSLEEARAVLAAKRREGFAHVTFTGGEPTLHPRFVDLLQSARALGFRTQAITNGAAFAAPAFARRALPLLDELCLSVHGPTAAVHDALTRNRLSFRRVEAALAALGGRRSPALTVNAVSARPNAGRLAETAAFVGARARVRQFWVSALIPEGAGAERYGELAAPLSEAVRELPRVRAALPRSASLRVFGFPPCMLGEHRALASELYKNPSAAVARSRDGLRETDGAGGPPRRRSPRCAGCALARGCPGVFCLYLDRFGDAELKAVRAR